MFIISGGLIDAVKGFGRRLGVDPARIRAVELEYNELSGRWWDYAEPQSQQTQTYLDYDEGPLTISSGKSAIISALAADQAGRRLMIGDGSSDLATKDDVDLFVGFGGVVARGAVMAESDIFVSCPSLAPILPLAAGRRGWAVAARARRMSGPIARVFCWRCMARIRCLLRRNSRCETASSANLRTSSEHGLPSDHL